MTGLIENGPRSSQKMNSQSSHSNTWWLGGHHLLGSLSLKGRTNKYISLKWNHGCESAFLCHLFSECVVFFLLGSLIIIPCARTNVPKIEEIRRGSAVCAAVALHWCERGVHCTNSHQVYVLDRSPSSFVVGFKAWFALWKLVSLCKSSLPS